MQTLELIWTFFKIGIISFGGGWSIVGIIKTSVVPKWIAESDFKSLIAIAQSTPGPIALNAATLIGWNHGGFFSAIAATLSVVTFPVLAIIATTLLSKRVKLNSLAVNEALKSGTLAMMLMTLWVLKPSSLDPIPLVLTTAAFAVAAFTKINALWTVLGAGAFELLLGPWIRGVLGL
jgi:chromate transporter